MSKRRVTLPSSGFAALFAASLSFAACSEQGLKLVSASPSTISARGGQTITLRGSGFAAGVEVRLGGDSMKDLEIVSPEEIRFTAPPLFAGPLAVTVETEEKALSLPDAIEVLALDLRFDEAPSHSFSSSPDETIVGATTGDFDGDGDVDLVTCAKMVPCRMMRNDGRGNFADSPKGKSGARFPDGMPDTSVVASADFDGDGDQDLFVGLASGGAGVVLRNDGSATFTEVFTLPFDTGVTAAAIGDIDGDGLPDLVTAHAAGDMVPLRVHRNRAKGSKIVFQPASEETVPAGDWAVTAVTLVDVDADGTLDLVIATPGAADGITIRVLIGSKAGFDEAPGRLPSSADTDVRAFAVGDVNGDGSMDVVAVGAHRDRLFLNDGTGHFFDATTGGMPVDAAPGTSVALVDLDRDRDLDLVIGNAGAETRIYLNDGSGRFFDHTPILPIRADATVWVGAVDVDGDADQDLLLVNASPDPARLYISVEPKDAP